MPNFAEYIHLLEVRIYPVEWHVQKILKRAVLSHVTDNFSVGNAASPLSNGTNFLDNLG